MNRKEGFTLVEVVVVIAIVALLSAIIVPMVAKQIDDAKIGRAKNECLVISAAIAQFYKDVGVWPAAKDDSGARVDNALTRLVSGTSVGTIDGTNNGLSWGYTSATNDDWYDDNQSASAGKIDIFSNHLNANKPEGVSGAAYAITGDFRWKGPYMPPIGDDPWGHHYICNIDQSYTGNSKLCVVISAGPNGAFDTAVDPASTVVSPSGDDIWIVVHTR